ncbi:DUF2877 domain-containing protein [Enterococcus sp. 669A]|uniref:DUF2877 domain-containing protein n=1 Tax=Candidatus Enterococcus moelleringii TaxID=2815325 RepID=A0ABS3L8H6_9ENTE|nr:DUF2877 domain-containing protein [Enterococcus sp. 669A]MBO1305931.1 DUF2877 domain-containing protein [Enterococcus sp. 669A]
MGPIIEDVCRNAADSSFYLHSTFANGFNLMNDQQLVFIGHDSKGAVPFGIHLSADDFNQVKQLSERVYHFEKDTEQYCIVGKQSRILLKSESLYDSSLEPTFEIDQQIFKRNIQLLRTRTLATGLAFEEEINGTSIPFQNLFSAKKAEVAKGIFYYIGRGIGLTPSGDDFLVGLLAMDQLFSILPQDFRGILASLAAEGKWTTVVSNAYLASACNNQFSSLVKNAAAALVNSVAWPQAAAELEASGSTSGCDTLAGILAGANLYLNKGDRNR